MKQKIKFDPDHLDFKIFECVTGSRLYGTHTEISDYDYRGVCLPPEEILLDPFMNFDQKDSGFENEDKTIYALAKFFKLCADANPNIIEMLFIPNENILHMNNRWKLILENKHLFLSKKARYTFSGYAISQLNAIKRRRQWFINPPTKKPTRFERGLPDVPLISGEGLDAIAKIGKAYLHEAVVDEIYREVEYRIEKKKWDNYMQWFKNRNPERKILEDKHGYDTKHAYHLFRLIEEGRQLLLTGEIRFPLNNREFLLGIKNGSFSYEQVVEEAEKIDLNFNKWYEHSELPFSADRKGLTELYFRVIMDRTEVEHMKLYQGSWDQNDTQ